MANVLMIVPSPGIGMLLSAVKLRHHDTAETGKNQGKTTKKPRSKEIAASVNFLYYDSRWRSAWAQMAR